MNEELIRQAVADTVHCENYPTDGGFRTGQEDAAEAIRLYHARHVAPLVEALRAVTPITVHNTPDYAELTFGGSQTQAMTMEPEKWEAVNSALAPFQQENSND